MLDGANTSALVWAQAAASFSRWEFANIAAAVALLSIALAAVALLFFRRKARELTLIYFGLFCILYSLRLLTTLSSFRSLFHEQLVFWSYVNWVITCMSFCKRSAIFLRLFSQTPFSRTSPVFPATTPPARRSTTLPSSSSTFGRTLRVRAEFYP